jgi:hypothetical protein
LHFRTHNRPIQTTCWRHITLHVRMQPNALTHAHKSPSIRTTRTQTSAQLSRTRRLQSAVWWVRCFRHNILHDARKLGPIQFSTFIVGDSLNAGY